MWVISTLKECFPSTSLSTVCSWISVLLFYSSVLKSFSVSLSQFICPNVSLFLHLSARVSVVQYLCYLCFLFHGGSRQCHLIPGTAWLWGFCVRLPRFTDNTVWWTTLCVAVVSLFILLCVCVHVDVRFTDFQHKCLSVWILRLTFHVSGS